ncbi:MAG: DUF6498-containing protein [Crocinitomicaceae bacterium]|nr:hypothetical protein [Crocinitomicaceae bacterium]
MTKLSLSDINFRSASVISLLAVNLGLLVLGLILQWKIFDIIVIYWVENLVIGFYNIFKLALASGRSNNSDDPEPPRLLLLPIFPIHYFGFCLVHGIFIMVLFSDMKPDPSQHFLLMTKPLFESASVIYGLIALLISHGISFATNYVGKKEYLSATPTKQMFAPYKRIALVHVVVIVSGIIVMYLGKDSALLMIIFVLAKVALDLRQHLMERKNANTLKTEQ